MKAKHRAVVVVVPAHNESAALPACLNALSAAAAAVDVPVTIVVVLDGCDDDSARLAGRHGADICFIQVDERNVGAARAAGFRYADDALGLVRDRTWYATTDADTEVPRDWLRRQFASSADVALGVVRVKWRTLPTEVADRYHERYESEGPGHRHVHGANMGFRAHAYWRVGGFASLASGEDVELVERLESAGYRISWDDELSVATSDRRVGRAPGGFADHLAEVSQEVSDEIADEAS